MPAGRSSVVDRSRRAGRQLPSRSSSHRRLRARPPAAACSRPPRRPAGARPSATAPDTAPPASSSTSTPRTRASASKPTPRPPHAPACRSAHTCSASPASSDRTHSCELTIAARRSCSFGRLLAGDAAAPRAPSAAPADPPGGLADKSLEDLMSVEVDTVFGAAKREQRSPKRRRR